MEDNKTLISLVNPSFVFSFNGKEYTIRKASLEQVVQYQIKVSELSKEDIPEAVKELKIVSYCIFLVLKNSKESNLEITEDYILNNCPGDVDTLDILGKLGFISPEKIRLAQAMLKTVQDKMIIKDSSLT